MNTLASSHGDVWGVPLTPAEIVAQLDQHIIGQNAAKKLVALALRNRWRRQNVPAEFREEITPKNILMIGATGVGKTEIARRLAKLIRAPFLKVEASKYTEVGYVGRDVESMIRDLAEISYNLVKEEKIEEVRPKAREAAYQKILAILVPETPIALANDQSAIAHQETKEKFMKKLYAGELDAKQIEIEVTEKPGKMMDIFPMMLGDGIDNLKDALSSMVPKVQKTKKVMIKDALRILEGEESEKLIDFENVKTQAIERAENLGIVFIDEIDKIAKRYSESSAEVSREGVQRDLLPIVEGSVVSTKYGSLRTDYILFVAAGAFHVAKPSDLIPELQGRFPIRVELENLSQEDLFRVLKEPKQSLVFQYQQLLLVEGLELIFQDDALREIAKIAFNLNTQNENIGARRLQALMEKTLEEISFHATGQEKKQLVLDADYVRKTLENILEKQDLSRYIL